MVLEYILQRGAAFRERGAALGVLIDARKARVMEPLTGEPPDLMETMIPHWVYNRIAALLAAANAGEYVGNERVEGYVVAVLEGHVRRLNL